LSVILLHKDKQPKYRTLSKEDDHTNTQTQTELVPSGSMNQVAHFVKKRAFPVETDLCVSTEKMKNMWSYFKSDGMEIV
jgi:hypothetical protein